jgi:CRISPR system Cascade subunit CasB
MAAAACPIVLPFVPPGEDTYRDRAFFLAGALFALHPAAGGTGVSLGHAFRRLNDRIEGSGNNDNESLRRRFVALLDADPEDVGNHVRHAVSLARANDIPLDWARLLLDLWCWRNPSRHVQRRLARDFWKTPENALRAEGDASE